MAVELLSEVLLALPEIGEHFVFAKFTGDEQNQPGMLRDIQSLGVRSPEALKELIHKVVKLLYSEPLQFRNWPLNSKRKHRFEETAANGIKKN